MQDRALGQRHTGVGVRGVDGERGADSGARYALPARPDLDEPRAVAEDEEEDWHTGGGCRAAEDGR